MWVGDLFNILSDYEKELIYDISLKWHKEEERKRKLLREENSRIIKKLTNDKISPRLLTSLLDYYSDSKVNEDYNIKLIDIKNIRGVGKELAKEFNNLFVK